MNKTRFANLPRLLSNSFKAVLMIAITTIPLALIGRDTLGESVIALLYLVPVAWSANRWGQLPGISAALTAALVFDFLFIPPFYTFAVARLEGWLVLAIFLGVAVVVVERIQSSLSKAREAVYMYELSAALCNMRTPDAVAHTVARNLQQLFQAALVNVTFHTDIPPLSIMASEPSGVTLQSRPDRVLALLNGWGMVGEIQIWRGLYTELPGDDSRLMQNFASQTSMAFERTQMFMPDSKINGVTSSITSR